MNDLLLLLLIALGGMLILVIVALSTKKHSALDKNYFSAKWMELQRLQKSKDTWPLYVIQADNLLDEALKRRNIKGATMGERLKNARAMLSDNNSVWTGHKLRNKIVHETGIVLKEREVQEAVSGIRLGLKDLGAL